jgi:hypothetical protein
MRSETDSILASGNGVEFKWKKRTDWKGIK